ncbi:hypothetical protein PIB30_078327 [Stylosanthes scabra]|uniref:NB-ARC domain-containing protein n=1 Tax=Stylosanthes scabra TaxID=79078 RepID=A0ABU6SR92_9FABA|nr:hypothetical protein [Stylosanthes scabra]
MTYGEAFSQHEERLGKESDKIETWQSAMRGLCELIGIECHKKYETKLIQMIIKDVSARLPPLHLQIKEEAIVGLDSRFDEEEVKLFLDKGNNDAVHMLAIHGPPGISKITFVAYIYNIIISNDDQYTAASFISNIREKSKVKDLQSMLLAEMGEKRESSEGDTNNGAQEIIRKLGVKKVLLVLDDVDKIEQLKSLAGGFNWFGLGRRIIITTRHPTLLNRHRDHDKIKRYKMSELNPEDSLKLFYQYAFGESQPEENFANFATRYSGIKYCKGFSLGLKSTRQQIERL